jgi:hypothetical protein
MGRRNRNEPKTGQQQRFLVLFNRALTIALRRPETGNQFQISDFNSQV